MNDTAFSNVGRVAQTPPWKGDTKGPPRAKSPKTIAVKGSWFIFQKYDAHEDDCRFRAPDWHATKLMSHDSHQNYHLGFRCCKNIRATQTQ